MPIENDAGDDDHDQGDESYGTVAHGTGGFFLYGRDCDASIMTENRGTPEMNYDGKRVAFPGVRDGGLGRECEKTVPGTVFMSDE